MRQWHRALKLVQSGEHFHKNLLCEVFLQHAPGKMRAHDFNDQRVKVIDQFARRRLVALAHPRETGGQVEGLVGVRHGTMESKSYTGDKTHDPARGYNLCYDRAAGLTGRGRKPYVPRPSMRNRQQALRLSNAHDL